MKTTHFPHNGPTRVALSYAAMRKTRAFTNMDLYKCFYNKFRRPSEAQKSLELLSNLGFITPVADSWVITNEGFIYLKKSSKEYFRKNS